METNHSNPPASYAQVLARGMSTGASEDSLNKNRKMPDDNANKETVENCDDNANSKSTDTYGCHRAFVKNYFAYGDISYDNQLLSPAEEEASFNSSSESSLSDEEVSESEDNEILSNYMQTSLRNSQVPLACSFKKFEESLPETVSVLHSPSGSVIFLVGTAHFSKESQEDVAMVIRGCLPDTVMVELCKSRISILTMDEESILEEVDKMNLHKMRNIFRENGFVQGVMYLLMLNMTVHVTKQLGMAPGGEFRTAFRECKKIRGCVFQFGDRPLHITFQRALAKISLWQKLCLAWNIMSSKSPVTVEEVERCKKRDLLEKMLADMTRELPELSEVFVRERDIYLAHSLMLAAEHNAASLPRVVVGVVGIGHVAGIKEYFGKVTDEDVAAVMQIPESSKASLWIRRAIRFSVIGLGLFVAHKWFSRRFAWNWYKHLPRKTLSFDTLFRKR